MGLFSFKKKPAESLDLPPPPIPDEFELPPMPEPSMDTPEAPIEPMEEHIPSAEHEVHEEPEQQPLHLPARAGPLFVSVQDYQAILNSVNGIRARLNDADESFKKLNEIKASQDKQLDDWRGYLENVQKKLTYVDEVLFER